MNDKGTSIRLVGIEQLIFESHASTEIQRPRVFCREHVRAAFDQIAVSADRFQNSTDSMTRLEQRHFGVEGRSSTKPMCGRESGNASADHGDSSLRFVGRLSSWRRMSTDFRKEATDIVVINRDRLNLSLSIVKSGKRASCRGVSRADVITHQKRLLD